MQQEPETVCFEVLLKSGARNQPPRLDNLDARGAPAEAIEKCLRWLAQQDVTCYRVPFGLVCYASREVFESLFGRKAEPDAVASNLHAAECHVPRDMPADIAKHIDQITLSVPPELF